MRGTGPLQAAILDELAGKGWIEVNALTDAVDGESEEGVKDSVRRLVASGRVETGYREPGGEEVCRQLTRRGNRRLVVRLAAPAPE